MENIGNEKNINEEFKQISENITIVIWKAKVNEKYEFEQTYISPVVDEILALPKGTIKNDWSRYFKYVKPEYLPEIQQKFGKAFSNPGTTEFFEYEVTKANKERAWFRSEGRCEIKDGDLFVFGTTADITRQKETEKALKISEKRLKEAQKTAHIGHWELDLRTDKLVWSDEIYRIFDLKPQEFEATYQAFLSNIHPDDRDFVNEAYSKSVKQKKGYNIVHRLKLKEGKIKYVNERCITTYDDNGNPKRSIGTVADITAQIENEQKIKQQNLELQRINAEKDKLFSIISHDLRSPFNALIGFSEILQKKIDNYDKTKIKKIISHINNTATTTYDLLNDLLKWANFHRGQIEFKPQKIDLLNFTTQKISLIQDIAAQKEIEIKNKIAEETEVFADENMLSTILRNLLTNAVKFTNRKGKVSIFTTETDKNIEISVKDNGIGISEEKQKKLFRIESNISEQGTENEDGTGLGLILCREFVEKHGGKIWVKSKTGKGSIFTFSIPKIEKNQIKQLKINV